MTEPGSGDTGGYTPPPPFARPADPGPAPYPYGYPGYAYPPPGYPGYPPPYGYGYPPPPPRARPQLAFGVVAASIAGAGVLMVAIALLALPWFSVRGGLTASDIRGVLDDSGDLANDLSVSYFSWFAWVLLLFSAACAAAAALPHAGLSLAFRIAGPILAGFAVLFTVGSMELTNYVYSDNAYYFEHLAVGFWVAVIGFVCIGAGCIAGPRKRAAPADTGSGPPPGATFSP